MPHKFNCNLSNVANATPEEEKVYINLLDRLENYRLVLSEKQYNNAVKYITSLQFFHTNNIVIATEIIQTGKSPTYKSKKRLGFHPEIIKDIAFEYKAPSFYFVLTQFIENYKEKEKDLFAKLGSSRGCLERRYEYLLKSMK